MIRPGPVHLSVASLERSLDYYAQLGLTHRGDGVLGAGGEDLVVLSELPGARPADGFAGLFHFALLVPDRAELGAWLARNRLPLTGLSDHAVSEAIYLRDPDGHGIEIYADRPRELWEGRVRELMTTVRLDTDDLLAAAAGHPYTGLAEGTIMGHVHLRVSDVAATTAFYTDELGLEPMAEFPGQAVFLAAGGYHHHVGANVWESRGAPLAPPDRARLLKFELIGADAPRTVTDPSGITVELKR